MSHVRCGEVKDTSASTNRGKSRVMTVDASCEREVVSYDEELIDSIRGLQAKKEGKGKWNDSLLLVIQWRCLV